METITITFNESPVNFPLTIENPSLVKVGEKVVIETPRGLEIGKVVALSFNKKEEKENKEDENEKEVFSFVRVATERDLKADEENKKFASQVKLETKKLIRKHGLEMKVSDVSVVLDRSKVVISFTAENRVDFRELVKELASTFKARIELRQIGSRDETRAMGGFGPCGKECCCKQFLNDFEHVSIKMAKTQNLSLNPTKVSGLCGRLLCCLGYENEHYAETSKLMPKVGSFVETPNGKGKVVYNDLLKRIVQVKVGDENNFEIKNFDLNEIKKNKE